MAKPEREHVKIENKHNFSFYTVTKQQFAILYEDKLKKHISGSTTGYNRWLAVARNRIQYSRKDHMVAIHLKPTVWTNITQCQQV